MESKDKTIKEVTSEDEITPVIHFKLGDQRTRDVCTNVSGFNAEKCHIGDKNIVDNWRGNYNDNRAIKFQLNGDCMEENLNFIDSMTTEGPSSLNGYVSQSEAEYFSAKDFSIVSDSTVENEDFDVNYPVGNCEIQIFEINEVKNTNKKNRSNNNDAVESDLMAGIRPQHSTATDAHHSDEESNRLMQQSNQVPQIGETSFKNDKLLQKNENLTQEDNVLERFESNTPNIVEMRRKSDTVSDANDEDLVRHKEPSHPSGTHAEHNDTKTHKDNISSACVDPSSRENDVESHGVDEAFINNTMTMKRDTSRKFDEKTSLDSRIKSSAINDELSESNNSSDKSNTESSNANVESQDVTSGDKTTEDEKRNRGSQSSGDSHSNVLPRQLHEEPESSVESDRQEKSNQTHQNKPQNINNNDTNHYNYDLNFINGAFNWFKDVRSEQFGDFVPYGNNLDDRNVQKQDDNDFADFTNNIKSNNDPEDRFKVTENLKDGFDDSDRKHKKDNEVATRNILNAFLNQNFDESLQEMDYINEENHLPTVASITTSVVDAPSFDKIFHTMSERSHSKIPQDSIEYDSLNSGSYVSNGSTESLDKSGLERQSTVRSSVNNSKIQLPVDNDIQTCGKCCDDIKNNVIYTNNIDQLIKNDDLYKNGNKNQLSCSKNDKLSKDLFYVRNERVGKSSESDSRTSDLRTPRGSEQLDEKPSLTEIGVEKRTSLFRKMSTLPLGPPGGSGEHSNNPRLIDDEPSKFLWKRLLAQILAVSAKNTLALNFGMSVGFQTIAIPSLSKPNDDLFLDQQQISLYGSLFFTVIPVGCLLSGPTIHGWGRKPAMLVFCLPLFIGWWVYYFAKSPGILYLAILIMGLVNGLLEAPILTYVAEITEARWRGMLASSSVVAALFGVFLQMLLGNMFTWRVTAIINSVFPVISFIAICFVPESPHWLASKGRTKDVEKSLMWLRGWVDKSEVAGEVDSLVAAHSQPRVASNPLSWKAYASRTFVEPFLIIICSFAIGHFSGMATVQTYSVSIFDTLGVQGWSWTAAMGASQVLGATACVIALPLLGKRPIAVVSMVGVGIGMIGAATASGSLAASSLLLANFCTNACSRVVPWVLIGEVFTNEMRAVASGLSSCVCYVMAFVLSYTYLQVEAALTLRVLLGIYAAVGILGALAYYVFLPETEGKSLAEVQQHFERKQYKGTDNPAFDKENS